MALASKIKSIMHDIDATGVKIDIPLTTFIKALNPTYSHYLESLQTSAQMKSLTFDSLVEKVVKNEKDFRKKTTQPIRDIVCLAKKWKNQSHDFYRGEGIVRGLGKNNFRDNGGRYHRGEKIDLHHLRCSRNEHDVQHCWATQERITNMHEQKEDNSRAPKSTHYIVSHCNTRVDEDLFNTSFASWRDALLLDMDGTCHKAF